MKTPSNKQPTGQQIQNMFTLIPTTTKLEHTSSDQLYTNSQTRLVTIHIFT